MWADTHHFGSVRGWAINFAEHRVPWGEASARNSNTGTMCFVLSLLAAVLVFFFFSLSRLRNDEEVEF